MLLASRRSSRAAASEDGVSNTLESAGSNTRTRPVLPESPEEAYGYLLQSCLDADLDAMSRLEDNHLVSLSILSPSHSLLLAHAAKVWGLSDFHQSVMFAKNMIDLHLEESVPLECAAEAVARVPSQPESPDASRTDLVRGHGLLCLPGSC
jgi:hypothetical protein